MRRREFLVASGRAALGCSVLPLVARAHIPRPFIAHRPGIPELERLIQRLMQASLVPGAAIAVIRNGEVVWRRAFGVRDVASRVPVADDTVFEAASVSKTVFAYAAMNLSDKGVIDLDTPLARYTSERFLNDDPRLDRITTRHVLSHTAGFQNWRSAEEPLRIHFEPGERFLYSGEGYFYLQSAITHLRGSRDPATCARFEADLVVCATDIADFMMANVLAPFAMTSSGYLWNDTLARHAATPHDQAMTPLRKVQPNATGAARYAAAGGLHTTATDYARFLLEVIDPRPRDAYRLSSDTRREMLTPHVKLEDSTSWALGWQIRHTPRGDFIQHQGGQGGFQAFTAAAVERKSGYVMLTNSDSGWKVFYDQELVDTMDRFLTA